MISKQTLSEVEKIRDKQWKKHKRIYDATAKANQKYEKVYDIMRKKEDEYRRVYENAR